MRNHRLRRWTQIGAFQANRPGNAIPPFLKGGLGGIFSLALFTAVAIAEESPLAPPGAAIASAHPDATEAGFEILAAGGNAFDAAVAVSAVLAVVEPAGSGIGGGGFWLLQSHDTELEVMVDGRERAPLAATADMYLDEDGEFAREWAINGPLAAGIPGAPAAWVHIAEKYGNLPLEKTLAPAIRLAEEGFIVDGRMFKLMAWRRSALAAAPAASDTFLTLSLPTPAGVKLRQPDLAKTLKLLADKGHDGFYGGWLARKLVKGVQEAGGIWTLEDLAGYRVAERKPSVAHYRDYRILSASPPSSGGVVMATVLNILSGYEMSRMPAVQRKHHIIEALRRAYRDRALYLGDPDFVDMPLARLRSLAYAEDLRQGIDSGRATPSSDMGKPVGDMPGGSDTTHFSILDGQGNRVAATLSINLPFGSGFMPPDTGVLLNNEMDDFVAKPGTPNSYGLVGSQANAIAPGKRMLSSMSPTIVEGSGKLAILGTPGGSRIISMTILGILALIDDGATAESMVSLPRFHHQYLPDVVQYEKDAFTDDERRVLESMGHSLKRSTRRYGNMQAIVWNRQTSPQAPQSLHAASDPRSIGSAQVRILEPDAR